MSHVKSRNQQWGERAWQRFSNPNPTLRTRKRRLKLLYAEDVTGPPIKLLENVLQVVEKTDVMQVKKATVH